MKPERDMELARATGERAGKQLSTLVSACPFDTLTHQPERRAWLSGFDAGRATITDVSSSLR